MEPERIASLVAVFISATAAAGAFAVFTRAWRWPPSGHRVRCLAPVIVATPALCENMLTAAPAWTSVVGWLSFVWGLQAAAFALPAPQPAPRQPGHSGVGPLGEPPWWADFERAFHRYAQVEPEP